MKYFILPILFVLFFHADLGANRGFKQTGEASYYADKFHGRPTASGERFNMWDFTAAHKTLPFGTILRVTNLKNAKTVLVRVNDRGPYAHNRIIDLSKAAAAKIDMIGSGTAKVKLEITKGALKQPEEEQKEKETEQESFMTAKTYSLWGTEKFPRGWGVQVSSYRKLENAKSEVKGLIADGIKDVYIQVGWKGFGRIYRVIIGEEPTKDKARERAKDLKAKKKIKGVPSKHFDK